MPILVILLALTAGLAAAPVSAESTAPGGYPQPEATDEQVDLD